MLMCKWGLRCVYWQVLMCNKFKNRTENCCCPFLWQLDNSYSSAVSRFIGNFMIKPCILQMLSLFYISQSSSCYSKLITIFKFQEPAVQRLKWPRTAKSLQFWVFAKLDNINKTVGAYSNDSCKMVKLIIGHYRKNLEY